MKSKMLSYTYRTKQIIKLYIGLQYIYHSNNWSRGNPTLRSQNSRF
jgi:hypothetical protein